jgi:hypothetical protein
VFTHALGFLGWGTFLSENHKWTGQSVIKQPWSELGTISDRLDLSTLRTSNSDCRHTGTFQFERKQNNCAWNVVLSSTNTTSCRPVSLMQNILPSLHSHCHNLRELVMAFSLVPLFVAFTLRALTATELLMSRVVVRALMTENCLYLWEFFFSTWRVSRRHYVFVLSCWGLGGGPHKTEYRTSNRLLYGKFYKLLFATLRIIPT